MIKIKNRLLILLSICSVLICGCANKQSKVPAYDTINVVENLVIDERSVPIFPKKAALTTDTAQRFALDLPKFTKKMYSRLE